MEKRMPLHSLLVNFESLRSEGFGFYVPSEAVDRQVPRRFIEEPMPGGGGYMHASESEFFVALWLLAKWMELLEHSGRRLDVPPDTGESRAYLTECSGLAYDAEWVINGERLRNPMVAKLCSTLVLMVLGADGIQPTSSELHGHVGGKWSAFGAFGRKLQPRRAIATVTGRGQSTQMLVNAAPAGPLVTNDGCGCIVLLSATLVVAASSALVAALV